MLTMSTFLAQGMSIAILSCASVIHNIYIHIDISIGISIGIVFIYTVSIYMCHYLLAGIAIGTIGQVMVV